MFVPKKKRASKAPAARPAAPGPDRIAYSLREVATMLGVSYPHIKNQIKAGALASFRSGHRRLVSRAALDAYMGR